MGGLVCVDFLLNLTYTTFQMSDKTETVYIIIIVAPCTNRLNFNIPVYTI